LGCTTNQRGIPFAYLHLLVQVHHGPLLYFLLFIAEEVDGEVDMGSGDMTMFDIQTLFGGLFEHVPEICLFRY
jgi:hypothetical protein